MTPTWEAIWESRRLDPAEGSTLAQLLAADGFETGFGDVEEAGWLDFVRQTCDALRLAPGASVYDVGCGAGAFLWDLRQRGFRVAGLDRSAALIDCAREVMPEAELHVGEAAALDPEHPVDAVISCSVFFYFPTREYAEEVIRRMGSKARHAVAILDVPDAATEAQARAHREALAGGPEAYAARYDGLEHLYFERDWMRAALEDVGLVDVEIADQQIAGYGNARFRFNAWGFQPQPGLP